MGKLGAVSVYAFDYDGAAAAGWIREFQQADAEWLDFVVANRRGSKPKDDAMIHIGPVADDSVYATIQLYETGILNSHETIRRPGRRHWPTRSYSIRKKRCGFADLSSAVRLECNSMDQNQFAAIMPHISAGLADLIAKKHRA